MPARKGETIRVYANRFLIRLTSQYACVPQGKPAPKERRIVATGGAQTAQRNPWNVFFSVVSAPNGRRNFRILLPSTASMSAAG